MRSRAGVRIQCAVAVLCPLLLAACMYGEDEARDRREQTQADGAKVDACRGAACADSTQTDASGAAASSEPFSTQLAGVVSQATRWAGLDVSIESARLARGLDAQNALASDVSSSTGRVRVPLDPSKIYAELILKLDNMGASPADYEYQEAWDLLLADGRRLSSVEPLGVVISPGEIARTSLHYAVEDLVDLRGAKLELNGRNRQLFEPAELPLDHVAAREFPRRVTSLVGEIATYRVGSAVAFVQIQEAAYDINYARRGRAARDKRAIWMQLAFAPSDGDGDLRHYDTNDLRIVVDGHAVAPKLHDAADLEAGTTTALFVGFEIDEDATHFEIAFPDGSPDGQRFAVDTTDTMLASDIP